MDLVIVSRHNTPYHGGECCAVARYSKKVRLGRRAVLGLHLLAEYAFNTDLLSRSFDIPGVTLDAFSGNRFI
jgi:hypothetical protein